MKNIGVSPKAVIFDAGDTLIVRSQSFESVLCERYGASLRGFDGAVGRLLSEQPETFEIRWDDESAIHSGLKRLYSEAGALYEDYRDDMSDYLVDYIREPDAWSLASGTRHVLKALKQEGYLLGIVSNWRKGLSNILIQLEIESYFDTVVSSSDVGSVKPDPIIFLMSYLEMRRLRPQLGLNEIIMVGDSYRHDIEPAVRLGMSAIHLTYTESPPAGREMREEVQNIHRLQDMLTLGVLKGGS